MVSLAIIRSMTEGLSPSLLPHQVGDAGVFRTKKLFSSNHSLKQRAYADRDLPSIDHSCECVLKSLMRMVGIVSSGLWSSRYCRDGWLSDMWW